MGPWSPWEPAQDHHLGCSFPLELVQAEQGSWTQRLGCCVSIHSPCRVIFAFLLSPKSSLWVQGLALSRALKGARVHLAGSRDQWTVESCPPCKYPFAANLGGCRSYYQGKWSVPYRNRLTDSMDMSSSKFQEMVKDRETRSTAVHGVTELGATEQLNKPQLRKKQLGLYSEHHVRQAWLPGMRGTIELSVGPGWGGWNLEIRFLYLSRGSR